MVFKFLKGMRKTIICFVIIMAIVLVCGRLYHQPIKATIYPVVLGFVVFCIFLAVEFFRYRKKEKWLLAIKDCPGEVEYNLPVPEDGVEAAYQMISLELDRIRREQLEKHNVEIKDMLDYYGVWVHQIKTPIASMKLQLGMDDSIYQRQLSSDLFRIEQYVEMVLAYLRMNSEYTDYVFKEYDLDEIIRNVIKRFSSEFILRKISLHYEPVEYKAILDEKWFSFVLEQIVSNSLKYTDQGSISVYMKGDILYIEDTGIGIAPEDTERIFEKGYTGYNGRLDKASTGLGLYLCKEICKNLSIDIAIESEVSKGTKVKLNLKRYDFSKE